MIAPYGGSLPCLFSLRYIFPVLHVLPNLTILESTILLDIQVEHFFFISIGHFFISMTKSPNRSNLREGRFILTQSFPGLSLPWTVWSQTERKQGKKRPSLGLSLPGDLKPRQAEGDNYASPEYVGVHFTST